MEDNDTPQKRKAHLTRDQRMTIEAMLNKGLSFHEIAKAVNVHHSTISREVKSRRREENIGARGMTLNRCIHRTQCDKRQICMDRPDCLRRCGSCSRCNTRCPKFEEERCIHHLKAPYVCNGCHRRHACILRKLVYRPLVADKITVRLSRRPDKASIRRRLSSEKWTPSSPTVSSRANPSTTFTLTIATSSPAQSGHSTDASIWGALRPFARIFPEPARCVHVVANRSRTRSMPNVRTAGDSVTISALSRSIPICLSL